MTIVIIGAGAMGGSLAEGLLSHTAFAPALTKGRELHKRPITHPPILHRYG